MSEDHDFNANKIFFGLLVLTMLEVAWGIWMPLPVWAVRSGLVIFAIWKGYLIFTYFMHMKWEGWICKGLIAPTIPLVAIVLFANMPDTSFNGRLQYHVGDQYIDSTGDVVGIEDAAATRRYGDKRFLDEQKEH